MDPVTVTFIGAGNMGRCLIGGLIANGHPAARLCATDSDAARLDALRAQFGILTDTENRRAAADSDVLVLAVKPQVMREVALELAPALARPAPPVVISIAAGIRTADLARWLGAEVPLVRAMPNTPALVQAGASALYAAPGVSERQRELAEGILRSAGLTLWVEREIQLDAVTVVSGSGPAYFFRLMELVQQAGQQLGLSEEQARALTVETAFGAAKMALESGLDPAVLRAQVTSPGGTTQRALEVLDQGGLAALVEQALRSAFERAGELADRYGAE